MEVMRLKIFIVQNVRFQLQVVLHPKGQIVPLDVAQKVGVARDHPQGRQHLVLGKVHVLAFTVRVQIVNAQTVFQKARLVGGVFGTRLLVLQVKATDDIVKGIAHQVHGFGDALVRIGGILMIALTTSVDHPFGDKTAPPKTVRRLGHGLGAARIAANAAVRFRQDVVVGQRVVLFLWLFDPKGTGRLIGKDGLVLALRARGRLVGVIAGSERLTDVADQATGVRCARIGKGQEPRDLAFSGMLLSLLLRRFCIGWRFLQSNSVIVMAVVFLFDKHLLGLASGPGLVEFPCLFVGQWW